MRKPKSEIISFKADDLLLNQLERIPNRSEFIRNAVQAALGSLCPLCNGTGILTRCQREHWDEFQSNHRLEECKYCREVHVVCGK
jgi:hypothetical protein